MSKRDDAKLAKLIEIEGYDTVEALLQAVLGDSVSPAICMNEDCDRPKARADSRAAGDADGSFCGV